MNGDHRGRPAHISLGRQRGSRRRRRAPACREARPALRLDGPLGRAQSRPHHRSCESLSRPHHRTCSIPSQEETVTDASVRNLPFDSERVARWGPMLNDYRSAVSGLEELGATFMTFDDEMASDWTTLAYEEVIYVISGNVSLTVREGQREMTVRGAAGDLLTLQKGASVRYSGTMGSRSLVCYVPVDYLTREG